MNKHEKELFWELCGFEKTDKNKLELLVHAATPTVLGHLFFNRMQAIAYGTLKQNGLLGRVNREFRNSLAGAYQQNVEKNKSFFQCLEMLSGFLNGYKYAMLKGALLCGLYPEGYRTSNDIDLLVRPEHVTAIGTALTKAGFKQGNIRNGEFEAASRREIIESKMTRGETVPYILEVNLPYMRFLEVDINFSLDYKNSDTEALESMLNRTTTVTGRYGSIATLDKYDFFIHLCSHLYKEAATLPWVKMKRDMTLYKFCDIYMLLCDFKSEDVLKLFRRAEELQMTEICSCAVLWTNALFGSNNSYAQECARYSLADKEMLLHEVTDPAEHTQRIYTEQDIRARFFANDRMALLQEV